MSYFTNHLDGTWPTRDTHWAMSGALRASERHLGLAAGTAIAGDILASRTPLNFWQSASMVVIDVASGLSYAWIAGRTALEARLIDRMLKACAGLSPEQSNTLAQKIMRQVDALLPTKKERPFPEVYDVTSFTPKPEYEAGLLRVMDELGRMGMPLQ
jgi:hypothetical protein